MRVRINYRRAIVKMVIEDAGKENTSSETLLDRAIAYLVELGVPPDQAKENLQQMLAVCVAAAEK